SGLTSRPVFEVDGTLGLGRPLVYASSFELWRIGPCAGAPSFSLLYWRRQSPCRTQATRSCRRKVSSAGSPRPSDNCLAPFAPFPPFSARPSPSCAYRIAGIGPRPLVSVERDFGGRGGSSGMGRPPKLAYRL